MASLARVCLRRLPRARVATRAFATEASPAPAKGGVHWSVYAGGAAVLATGAYYFSLPSIPIGPRVISASEIARHKVVDNRLWIAIAGGVYDITDYLNEHPIGPKALLHHAGEDISVVFKKLHKPDSLEKLVTGGKVTKVGVVDPASPPPEPAPWSPPKR